MRSRTRALFTALAALLVGLVAYLVGVGSSFGQQAEASVLEASKFTSDPPGPLSLVSPTMIVVCLVAICLTALWVHGISRTLTILGFSVIGIVTSQLLKESWLERPHLFELDASNTFPSGHMTVFAVLLGALIWALPRTIQPLVLIMSAFVLSVVSWQLLEYGWHRPSDLVGAQALAVCVFALAASIGPRGSRRATGELNVVAAMMSRIVLIVLAVSGLLLVVGGIVLVMIAGSIQSIELMLNGGEITLIGVSALTTRTLAKLCP